MGISSTDAQGIVQACKTYGVPLSVAYYRRYWPITRKLKELLDDGAIGPVVQAQVQLSDTFNGDSNRPWLTSLKQAGGGALANAGSHWVDLVRYLLGEIEDVMAYCSFTAGGFEVEDTAGVLMRTTDDALVSLISSWQGGISVNDLDITGTQGRILASPLSGGRLLLYRRGKDPETFELTRSGPAHSEFIEELVSNLRAGQSPPVPGEEAVAVWRIMEAAYRSNREGICVRI
jgi:predicted dehydrogenase